MLLSEKIVTFIYPFPDKLMMNYWVGLIHGSLGDVQL